MMNDNIRRLVEWKIPTLWHDWSVMMKKRAMHLGILSTALLLLAACSVPAAVQPETQEIIVTRDERDLPEGCSPREAAQLMMRLLNAFNSGDQEQFIQFFPPTFQWYSDGWRTVADGVDIDPEHLFVSRPGNRQDLPNYLAERHQQADRLQLIMANVAEDGQRRALVNFRFVREADDVESGVGGNKRYVHGVAVIICESQTFFSLGMGIAPPDIQESDLARTLCPEPSAGAPENAVIVCSEAIFVPEEGE